ncbi:MAG: T9SS type A sorting domain-containing protein [Ignavibacteriaceae bacterium]
MMEKKISRLTVLIISVAILAGIDLFGQCTPYLGQIPPTSIVKRFPPSAYLANSIWVWHGTPIFSPDGNEMYWVKIFENGSGREMWFTKCINGQWAAPQRAPFSSLQTEENNPQFLESNDTLYFFSRRPGGFIFKVSRTPSGWSEPVALSIPIPPNSLVGLQYSITENKTVYFEAIDTLHNGSVDIYRAEFINGQYPSSVKLSTQINTTSDEFVGYVDSEDRFLIYSADKQGGYGNLDMYIAKRNPNNTWSTPVNLGPKVNSAAPEIFPTISPDGLYFLFTTQKAGDSGYNPYWVSAQFIYDMVSDIETEPSRSRDFNLSQNYPNPFNPNTVISYQLPVNSLVRLELYSITGEKVATLVNDEMEAGYYNYQLSTVNYQLSSGVYFYRLFAGEFVSTKKMVVLK